MRRIGVILGLIILVGCSSSSATTKYGAQYLHIIAPANTALTRFQDKLSSLGNEPARSDVAKAATPLISAIHAVDQDLERAPWPRAVETDIKAEVAADSAIRADLSAAGAKPNWQGQLHSDESKASADARTVRGDLHLPGG